MAFSGNQITRLGLCASTRGLYGSFAGKAEAALSAFIQYIGLQIGMRIGL